MVEISKDPIVFWTVRIILACLAFIALLFTAAFTYGFIAGMLGY